MHGRRAADRTANAAPGCPAAVPTVEDQHLWAAIGDPSRLPVLDRLLARGEATQSAPARELPLSRQAVARHLVALDRAGLVARRRGGREVLFSVRPARLDDPAQQLARVAERWDPRLETITRLAEQAHAANTAAGDQGRGAYAAGRAIAGRGLRVDTHTVSHVPPARHLLRAKDLADARYFDDLTVADLARAARLSRAHFSHEFRRAFGQSPHAYLLTRRLERAAALLVTTDRAIIEICLDVGLKSVGSFTTSFTRAYGLSPSQYRAAFPPASAYARVPACVVRAYGRPQHRTFREDAAPAPAYLRAQR